jgi:hypothetical protein
VVTHVVLMKFKSENQRANLEQARAMLLAMLGRVESLRAIEVGFNCVPSERAFDLSLITRFDDLAGLSDYADHPVHVEVKRFLSGVLEKSHVVDYHSE